MDRDHVAEHYARQRADIAAELADHDPGRWWFRIERWSGDVWDRLSPGMHVAAGAAIQAAERLATPRFEPRRSGPVPGTPGP